jgi:hypothetical protein
MLSNISNTNCSYSAFAYLKIFIITIFIELPQSKENTLFIIHYTSVNALAISVFEIIPIN